MSGLWLVSYVALWILVVVLAVIVLGLVRQLGLIHLRIGEEESGLLKTQEGLELGVSAPDFEATDIVGQTKISLAGLRKRPSILVFVSQSCPACQELMPHITEFQKSQNGNVDLILFNRAPIQNSLELVKNYGLTFPVIADDTGVIFKKYEIQATPFVYHVDKSGVVKQRGVVNSSEGLEALLNNNSSSETTAALPI